MKNMKKLFAISISALLIAVSLGFNALAEGTANVKVRIEGIEGNIFYGTVDIPFTDTLTVEQALKYVDSISDNVTVNIASSTYGSYLNGINGLNSGNIAPIYYDGWTFYINGFSSNEGISSSVIKDGDSILLFYSDMYGDNGFQIPEMDASKLNNGIIKFISKDTSYDENYNPVEKVNPVLGATVSLKIGTIISKFVTDKNGEILINSLESGKYTVQIEKLSDTVKVNGKALPLVLNLEPDTTVNFTKAVASSGNSTVITSKSDNTGFVTDTSDKSPKTGYDITFLLLTVIISGVVSLVSFKRIKA